MKDDLVYGIMEENEFTNENDYVAVSIENGFRLKRSFIKDKVHETLDFVFNADYEIVVILN